jgi:hypothetical protein
VSRSDGKRSIINGATSGVGEGKNSGRQVHGLVITSVFFPRLLLIVFGRATKKPLSNEQPIKRSALGGGRGVGFFRVRSKWRRRKKPDGVVCSVEEGRLMRRDGEIRVAATWRNATQGSRGGPTGSPVNYSTRSKSTFDFVNR